MVPVSGNTRFGITRRNFIGSATAGLSFIFLPGMGRVQASPYEISSPSDYSGRLCYNENPLGPSPIAITAMEEAASMAHRYPDWINAGLESAIAAKHSLQPANICAGAGATEIIRLIADAFLSPGDEMITASPTYFQMASEALANGASVVHVPVDGNHVIDLEQIALAITPSTKIISLVNPNNPLGTIIPKSEMATFIASIPGGIVIVVDEAYHDYVTNSDYESCVRYVGDLSPVIVVRTFSKVYGLAGARVGYSVSSPQLTGMIASSQLYGVISRSGQSAAGAALTDDSHITATLALNLQARGMLKTGLTNMGLGYIPSETNFLMFNTGGNADLIAGQLLSKGYQVRTGWGMPNHIRVSTGLLDEVEGFLDALAEVLNLNSVKSSEPPRTFGIHAVYPNPFNSSCIVEFTTVGSGKVHLSIYNLQGRKVNTIAGESLSPGVHMIPWDGTDVHGKKVSSGVYIFNLLQGELAATSKVTLMN